MNRIAHEDGDHVSGLLADDCIVLHPHPLRGWSRRRRFPLRCPINGVGGTQGAAAQCAQISLAARILPALTTIILAQDGDAAGDRQADTLRSRIDLPAHVRMTRHRPPDNTDWNDILRNRDQDD